MNDRTDTTPTLGSTFSIIEFAGADSAKLLEGQGSAATASANGHFAPLVCFCTPKGRMLANGQLIRRDETTYWLLTTATLAEDLLTHLKKFAAFYKTTLRLRSELAIQGFIAPDATLLDGPLPDTAWHTSACQDGVLIRHPGEHTRILRIAEQPLDTDIHADTASWQLEDVRAGVYWLEHTQREQWLPQMINWEALGGISFRKGCYTGQEVVARAHYRGQVKKRLMHLATGMLVQDIHPGDPVENDAGKNVGTVLRVADGEHQQELLAVVNVAALDAPMLTCGHALTQVPLPYPLERLDPESLVHSPS
ncbi:YgfZ/GcvT domain-containing protein [Larsenimonas rhizosphaerae]|uniref:CAF17-like 4Fe-4S cluster assembly/insertion protein YgfZ n=1 Tax=Larsenimonas rhizosphaerae TaxID=2944682 RepID=UPI0020336D71|nr:folate-binding protein [Larsenimonas rhizosphaerae]MCM2130651.1 folate-binding protein [Larsenimonas rhizosphaerae]